MTRFPAIYSNASLYSPVDALGVADGAVRPLTRSHPGNIEGAPSSHSPVEIEALAALMASRPLVAEASLRGLPVYVACAELPVWAAWCDADVEGEPFALVFDPTPARTAAEEAAQ